MIEAGGTLTVQHLEELGKRISEKIKELDATTDDRRIKAIRQAIWRDTNEWCRASLDGVTDEEADRMTFSAAAAMLSITESDVGELLRWGVLYDYENPAQVSRRGVEDLLLAVNRPNDAAGEPATGDPVAWDAWWKRLLTSDTAANSILWGTAAR